MSDSQFLRVEGLRELGERMRKLSADVSLRACQRATAKAARIVKQQAIANVIGKPSVDTGSLRDAIIVKKVPKSESGLTSEHMVTVRGRGKKSRKSKTKQTEAPHASKVEFGTVHMSARPFLRPAFDVRQGDAVNVIKDTLAAQINKAEGAA